MQRKAKSVGLECPARILSHDLDAAKMSLWMYEKKMERLMQHDRNQALLSDGLEGEDTQEDIDMES